MQPGETIHAGGASAATPEPPQNKPAEDAESDWQYQSDGGLPEATADAALEADVSWTASEYIHSQKSAGWYMGLGFVSALLTLAVYLITQSWLSAVVVALICLSMAVFAARQPQSVKYELSEDGVHVGPKFYPYQMFKSFSVIDDDAISSIWLRPLKRYMPTVNMYFEPNDEEKIVSTLDLFLPREDRAPDAIDRVSRRFRF